MIFPGFGMLMTHPDVPEWFISPSRPLPFLRNEPVCFVFECLEHSSVDESISIAVGNMLKLGWSALAKVEHLVYQFCSETLVRYRPEERPKIVVSRAEAVWEHVSFGSEVYVSRRDNGDDEDGIYFSIICRCAWEVEHGLQIVVRDGEAVSKLGAFDGHVTNSDAFGDKRLRGVFYKSFAVLAQE